jgi:carboxymethylenebutenolidase
MTDFQQLTVGDRAVRLYEPLWTDPEAPGVLVLHAWWGLNDDVIAYADRLASSGFRVIAPDMFEGNVATTIEDAEKLSGAGDDVAEAIVLAAVDELGKRVGSDARIGVLGFSFGAAYSILAPSERDRLAASVAYYGTYWGDFLSKSKAPLLGHFAENDPFEPAESVDALEQAMRDAGREATFHRYPGTGHWFAEPSRHDAYNAEAAELAFERTVAFLNDQLRPGG